MDGEYAIKVEKGEIVSVEPMGKAKLEEGVKQIDVKGKYVCPGLIDAHVHVCAVPGVTVSVGPIQPADSVPDVMNMLIS